MRADSARVKGLGRYAVLRTLDTGARRAMIHLGGRGESEAPSWDWLLGQSK